MKWNTLRNAGHAVVMLDGVKLFKIREQVYRFLSQTGEGKAKADMLVILFHPCVRVTSAGRLREGFAGCGGRGVTSEDLGKSHQRRAVLDCHGRLR